MKMKIKKFFNQLILVVASIQIEVEATISLNQYLEASSIIFGIAKTANESNVNQLCLQHLKAIEIGILNKETWAIKVLDSTGRKSPGFIWGHDLWHGSQQGCQAVQERVALTIPHSAEILMKDGLIDELSPFDVEYRVVYLKNFSPWQVDMIALKMRIIQIGLCLPKACHANEIINLVQDYLDSKLFLEAEVYDLRPQVIQMKDLKQNKDFFQKKNLKLMATFVGITLVLIIWARLLKNDRTETNKFTRFVSSFDTSGNWKSLFHVKDQTADTIPVINGLRSIWCFWLIPIHVFYFMSFTMDNIPFVGSFPQRLVLLLIIGAPILVEGFFTISGFLLVYKFLKNKNQLKVIKENCLLQNVRYFFKTFFHRFLRLGPLYLTVIGFVEVTSSYLEYVSLFYPKERMGENCSAYWWRNVIFIQNWFDLENICLSWTWSIACEMQYFLFVSLLLLIYPKYPKLIKITLGGLLLISVVWTNLVGISNDFQINVQAFFLTANKIYINSIVRSMPYLLGATAAFISAENNLRISKTFEQYIWIILPGVFFGCFFAYFQQETSVSMAINYYIFGRLIFSLGICWMIVCSAVGKGSWYSRILEKKWFQHFNRLSYAVYLLNPFVISTIGSCLSASIHGDLVLLIVLTVGLIVIIYALTIPFSLLFEIPYCEWSKKLLMEKPEEKK